MIMLLDVVPYPGDRTAASPNHGPRNADAIEGIVLHATQDAGNEAHSLAWLRSPRSRVSCHLLVTRGGHVVRLVGDQQRAWHAGAASWRGHRDVNSVTLGIEIANRNDGEPFTAVQYSRVAEIVAHYCRQGLSLADVVGHGDIAPTRRTDPLGWDWRRFRAIVNRQLLPIPVPEIAPLPPTVPLPDTVRVKTESGGARSPLTPIAAAARAALGLNPLAPAAAHAAPAPPAVTPAATRTPAARPAATAATREPAARPALASAPGSVLASPSLRQIAAATPKPMLYSRTLWLNLLTALAAAAAIIAQSLELAFWMGLTPPERVTVWILFALGVVNIALRFWTTQPICSSMPVRAAPDRDRSSSSA